MPVERTTMFGKKCDIVQGFSNLDVCLYYLETSKFVFFFHFGERERAQAGGGAEREGDTESEAAAGALSTEPDAGLEPTHREIAT